MNIEEARLYLEHTSKDDFNLEEWQKENRYQAIQVVLKEIERLNNDIKVLLKENENKEKVIKAQDNIIKEVREYIKENKVDLSWFMTTDKSLKIEGISNVVSTFRLLEILDKVNKEE